MIDNKINLPTYCCIAVLESCFMQCKMCYKGRKDASVRSPEEPSLDHWKKFLSDLAVMCPDKPKINFAGGEPLLREETLELAKYAAQLGFPAQLATNAYLINKEKAEQIADSGLSDIVISLDGVNNRTHDFLRGKEGSYTKVQEAIILLDKYASNIKISLNTVISAVNLNELVDLVRWVENKKTISCIGFQALTQPFDTPEEDRWYENPEYAFLWPQNLSEVDKVMDELAQLKGKEASVIVNPQRQFGVYKRYFRDPENFLKRDFCHLYKEALNITFKGDMRICFSKPSIGNIKDSSIRDAWFSQEAENVRTQIKQCRKNCQAMVNCNFDEGEDYVK
ncbi:MAG: radical SAM protein [Candidatus Omnitrophota bacterium]